MFTLRHLTIYILLMFTSVVKGAPIASFTANVTSGCSPLTVSFTNTSTNATSYYWDFGNGNTSTLTDPVNLYTIPGYYTVSLIAYNNFGQSDSSVQTNLIYVSDQPTANFYATTLAACLDGNSISFVNASSGATSWLWDFGDGTTSVLEHPVHSYTQSGTFTITLLASNNYGCQDIKILNLYITIYPKPSGTIAVNSNASCDPSTVFGFTLSNTTATSFMWRFGDTNTSSSQNPSHVYGAPGYYTVSCILTNALGCKDTLFLPNQIVIQQNNWAYFTVTEDSGCAPFTTTFIDPFNATNVWDFGDGTTAVQLYATHTYNTPGVYTVKCYISVNNGCSDTVEYVNFIHVGQKPTVNFSVSDTVGCAPHNVQFTNLSTNYTSSTWSFGDGNSINATNPSHVYTASGNFSVNLTCMGTMGCSASKTYSASIDVANPRALFSAVPRVGCPPLSTTFTNQAYGNNLSYNWDFGNGITSTLPNPTYTYNQTGSYDITLVVTDSMGCSDTLVKPAYIQTINPAANYIPPPTTVSCAPLTTQFTDATIGANSWLWDFGDGVTSTQQNPIHTYTAQGFYTVSLITTTTGGGCSQSIPVFSTFDLRGGYAGFSSTTSQCPPFIADFVDTSSNAVSWFWDFGDGTTSTQQSPSHVFGVGGYHNVSLTITTADGCTYTTMQSNGVYFPPFGANFFGIPLDTVFPADVQFYANSVGATQWLWDFGDSTTSTLENPLHTYQFYSNFDVTLTITNGLCTLFYDPPPFNFGLPDTTPFNPGNVALYTVQSGCAPLTVTFSNAAAIPGAVVWHWDFGDGDTSTAQYPVHTYFNRGIYSVTLTTWDTLGLPSILQMDSSVRVGGPIASFNFQQNQSCTNTQIILTNTSQGASSYNWNFGDGTTSTSTNANHTFTSGLPNYIVTLTATDTSNCNSSISTSIFANFISPLLASETDVCGYDSVHFSTSLTNYPNYLWHFGDGDSSTLLNPVHIYSQEGTYNVSLTVTDNSGCSQTFQLSPAVNVNYPVADFVATTSLHGCNNLRVDFANNSQNADSYFWDFGDGATSSLPTPSHVYNVAGTYTVSLSIFSGSCVNEMIRPNYVTIDTAHAEFNYTTNGQCAPVVTTFNDLSAYPVTWSWSFGTGIATDTSTLQNPTFSYLNTPGYSIALVMTDINGCTDTARLSPPPILDVVFGTGDYSGCVPYDVHFNAISSLAQSFLYDFGDGTTSTLQNPVHTYTTPGVYDIKVYVYGSPQNGSCVDSMIKTAYVTVREPLADFMSPVTTACAPAVINFSNLSADADNYLWNFGDSTTSTNDTTTHIYTTPGTYTVSLIAQTNNGCSDTIVRPLYINVLGPTTNFSISDFEGCAPFSVDFTDLSQNAVGWSWSFGDGNADIIQNATHVYSDTGTFTVGLITHDTTGCSSYYEYPQQIIVHPTPNASFNLSDTSGCKPVSVQFTNLSTGFDSLYWQFGNGLTANTSFPTVTYDSAGAYIPVLIASNLFGCSDTFQLPIQIDVYENPIAVFSADVTEGCSPLGVSFIDSSLFNNGGSFNWSFNNGTTSSQQNPQASFNSPGYYDINLTVINAQGCSNSVTLQNYIHVLDTVPPPITDIYSVSVLDNHAVEIIWENNPVLDLGTYELYRLNNATGVYNLIYTDTNPQNTSFGLNPTFNDSGLNTLHNVYSYKLATTDICANAIPLDSLNAHSTINVSSARQGNFINVTWNSYGGCSVSSYQIYRRDPYNTQWQYIDAVSPVTLSYLDTSFSCPWEYSYRIMATDLAGLPFTSWSDTSITYPINLLDNQVVDVVRSTVVNNQYVLTEWLPPVVHPEAVTQFDLYRSTDNNNFSYVTSLPAQQTDYTDYNVDVQTEHYYYKIEVQNICNISEALSGNTSTIVLDAHQELDRSIQLNWSPYNGWTNGVDFYIIERQLPDGTWKFISRVQGNITQFGFFDED